MWTHVGTTPSRDFHVTHTSPGPGSLGSSHPQSRPLCLSGHTPIPSHLVLLGTQSNPVKAEMDWETPPWCSQSTPLSSSCSRLLKVTAATWDCHTPAGWLAAVPHPTGRSTQVGAPTSFLPAASPGPSVSLCPLELNQHLLNKASAWNFARLPVCVGQNLMPWTRRQAVPASSFPMKLHFAHEASGGLASLLPRDPDPAWKVLPLLPACRPLWVLQIPESMSLRETCR